MQNDKSFTPLCHNPTLPYIPVILHVTQQALVPCMYNSYNDKHHHKLMASCPTPAPNLSKDDGTGKHFSLSRNIMIGVSSSEKSQDWINAKTSIQVANHLCRLPLQYNYSDPYKRMPSVVLVQMLDFAANLVSLCWQEDFSESPSVFLWVFFLFCWGSNVSFTRNTLILSSEVVDH